MPSSDICFTKQLFKNLNVLFKFFRSLAYRQFIHLVYGKLGKLRIPLPACAYQAIREQFGSKKDFTGFEDINSSDSE